MLRKQMSSEFNTRKPTVKSVLKTEHWRENKYPLGRAEAHLNRTLNARLHLRLSHLELTVEKVALIISGAVK